MRILFTGASSFTGFWFVQSLCAAGHDVTCALAGRVEGYTDIRRRRAEALGALCRLVPQAPFGQEAFLQLVAQEQFELLCHHAADVTNYRSADFNVLTALQNNTANLRATLAAMKARGLRGVIATGSVFENDEGVGTQPMRAFSPYGLSKGLTWQMLRFHCAEAQIPVGKFVIPNPFGPFEEPRFTAYLMRTWRDGKAAGVKTPDYLRDNIHADLLAAAYTKFTGRVAALEAGVVTMNPSGYVESQGEFAHRLAREVRQRLGWECKLELSRQEDFSEPLRRVNTEPAAAMFPNWSETQAWDGFANFYSIPK